MSKSFPSIIVLLFILSCQKDKALTKPVEFTTTTYEKLGAYDDSGKPNYLLPQDQVSTELKSFITNTLPENVDLRQSNPELLKSKAIADIKITQQSDVFITYISHGAGISNSFAFYTYPTSNPPARAEDIKTITYVLPNAGGGTTLQSGDKVKIGSFSPGTSIGFVLMQNAWNSTSKTLNNKAVHFCSNDVLNPEVDPNLKKHAVLINYSAENKVIIGFEDIDRTTKDCDHDFNDVVLYATVTP